MKVIKFEESQVDDIIDGELTEMVKTTDLNTNTFIYKKGEVLQLVSVLGELEALTHFCIRITDVKNYNLYNVYSFELDQRRYYEH